jgi:glycosyltransferase involved in cell wall biosynthesis
MLKRLNVLALTRYSRVAPSSRYRLLQFLPILAEAGIDVEVDELFGEWYTDCLVAGQEPPVGKVIAAFLGRIARLRQTGNWDVLWVEKELLPFMPWAVERFLLNNSPPLVLDLDDSHFHRYDLHRWALVRGVLGRKIDTAMARSSVVTAGSPYINDRARASGASRVVALPTVVDLARYPAAPAKRAKGEAFVVGWIGLPHNGEYLQSLRAPLLQFAAEAPLRIIVIGSRPDVLDGLPVEVRPWDERTEVADLQEFDVGIMPLPDRPFERGKCGLKLLQYMASWKPTIASPVGVNTLIVKHGESGFLANSEADWLDAFRALHARPELREAMGRAGHDRVEKEYSLSVVGAQLATLLRDLPVGTMRPSLATVVPSHSFD